MPSGPIRSSKVRGASGWDSQLKAGADSGSGTRAAAAGARIDWRLGTAGGAATGLGAATGAPLGAAIGAGLVAGRGVSFSTGRAIGGLTSRPFRAGARGAAVGVFAANGRSAV